MRLQKTRYCLLYVKPIRDYILKVDVYDQNTIYDYLSFREPKNNTTPTEPTIVLMNIDDIYPEELRSYHPNPVEFEEVDEYNTIKKIKKKKKKSKGL